jgi:hypothetical protein
MAAEQKAELASVEASLVNLRRVVSNGTQVLTDDALASLIGKVEYEPVPFLLKLKRNRSDGEASNLKPPSPVSRQVTAPAALFQSGEQTDNSTVEDNPKFAVESELKDGVEECAVCYEPVNGAVNPCQNKECVTPFCSTCLADYYTGVVE